MDFYKCSRCNSIDTLGYGSRFGVKVKCKKCDQVDYYGNNSAGMKRAKENIYAHLETEFIDQEKLKEWVTKYGKV